MEKTWMMAIKIHCIKWKFVDPESSCIFDKTLFFSIICRKCGYKYDGIFKEKETIEILKNSCLD